MANPYAPPIVSEPAMANESGVGRKAYRLEPWVIFLGLIAAAPVGVAITLTLTQPATGAPGATGESVRQIVLRIAAYASSMLSCWAWLFVSQLSSRRRDAWFLWAFAACCYVATILWIVNIPH